MSGLTEEQHDWEQQSNMKSSVRTHDVESMGSDEIPLRKIVIKTELDWQEISKKNDGGHFWSFRPRYVYDMIHVMKSGSSIVQKEVRVCNSEEHAKIPIYGSNV